MSALSDELGWVPRPMTPQQLTANRRESARKYGLDSPPTPHEIQAYLDAGLTPPTD